MKQSNEKLLESRLQKNLKLDEFLHPRGMMKADQLGWLSVIAKIGKPFAEKKWKLFMRNGTKYCIFTLFHNFTFSRYSRIIVRLNASWTWRDRLHSSM